KWDAATHEKVSKKKVHWHEAAFAEQTFRWPLIPHVDCSINETKNFNQYELYQLREFIFAAYRNHAANRHCSVGWRFLCGEHRGRAETGKGRQASKERRKKTKKTNGCRTLRCPLQPMPSGALRSRENCSPVEDHPDSYACAG